MYLQTSVCCENPEHCKMLKNLVKDSVFYLLKIEKQGLDFFRTKSCESTSFEMAKS